MPSPIMPLLKNPAVRIELCQLLGSELPSRRADDAAMQAGKQSIFIASTSQNILDRAICQSHEDSLPLQSDPVVATIEIFREHQALMHHTQISMEPQQEPVVAPDRHGSQPV